MKQLISSLIALVAISAGSGVTPAKSEAVLIDSAKVAAAFAAGGPLLVNPNYKIQAGRRQGPGQAEIHQKDTDIFYITEGTATIVIGGTAVDAKETGPDEVRGTKIVGGTTHQLKKGDVMVIPAGVAHWMSDTSKPFVYFIVKVTK